MSIWMHRSRAELRRFGLTFGAGLSVLSGILWWREKGAAPWILGVALTVAVAGLLLPRILAPLEWTLAGLFRVVTVSLTYVLVTLVFIAVVTPLGVLIRLFRGRLLALRREPARASYWVDVEPNGPASRPEKPF
jgi:hypothetical protein